MMHTEMVFWSFVIIQAMYMIGASGGMVELELENGAATSEYSDKHNAQKAFVNDSYWYPKRHSRLPQSVYNKFASKVQVSRFLVQGGYFASYFPRKFTFFGSNAEDCDNQEKWDLKITVENAIYDSHNIFQKEIDNPNMFSCYGIRVEHTESQYYTAIKRIRMYRPELLSYTNSTIIHFAQVWIDKPRNQILVGARNYLFRLSRRDLQPLEVVPWVPVNQTVDLCQQRSQKLEDCHNFIRVLLIHDSRVFTCGTNSFYPRCSWRRVDQLDHEEGQLDGKAMCPFSPHDNSTFLMTTNGDYYSATTLDFTGSDPAIYRVMGPSPRLRTAQYHANWLNEPDFVSAFEIGDFVYFFFRETAVEFANCGKAVYSRVARLCKNDVGGDALLRGRWTTFLKARLDCSIQGNIPFYYNYLQDVYYMTEASTFYATFTTGTNAIAGSAVCSYSLTNVDIAFNGPFTYQKNLQSTWQAVHNRNAGISQCADGGAATRNRHQSESQDSPSRNRRNIDRHIDNIDRHIDNTDRHINASKYHLMQLSVTPLDRSPMLKSDLTRWTHIVAHKPLGANIPLYTVLFVVTLEGRLQKFVSFNYHPFRRCLIEDIFLGKGRVLMMKLDAEEQAVIVGTENAVIKVPFERCHRHKTGKVCMFAQDPYCGWDTVISSCTPRPSANGDQWYQDVTSCPSNKPMNK